MKKKKSTDQFRSRENDLDSRLKLKFVNNFRRMVLGRPPTGKEMRFVLVVTNGPGAFYLATTVIYRFGR